MAVFNVASAQQLTTALSQAHGGDTILLAGGNYGDFAAASLKYSSNVTIQSASASNPATFNSFHLTSCQNIALNDVDVHMVPTATSVAWAAAVGIYSSTGISVTNSTITGGPAINGVPQTATVLDASGNVIGVPTGQGVTVVGSTGIALTHNSFSTLDKGVGLNNTSGVTISDNQFYNTRHGAVGGSNISDVAITDNSMSDSNPWAWAQPYGDHADFIHIWTSPPAQTSASTNITITGNVISQGEGSPIMGINFEAKTAAGSTTPVGFTGVNISDNAIILADGQGMRLENLDSSTVSNNTVIAPAGGGVTPGILFALGGATNTVVSGNVAGSIASQVNSSTNTFTDNYLAQDANPNAANYFNPALATQAAGMSDPAAILALIEQALPQTTTGSLYQNTAANIVANLPALNVSPTIAKIVITDNLPVVLTIAQWLSNGHVLGELVNQDGSPYHFIIKDVATTIAAGLDLLNGQANLSSIVISDNQPLWLKAAQVANDGAAIAKLVNANGSTPPLNISDTAANVGAVLDQLMAVNARLGNIAVTDKGTITLTAGQFVNDQSLLAKIHSLSAYYVRDTAANIDQQLDQLSALQRATGAHFTSVTITDAHWLQVSYAELTADANVIRVLANADGSPVKLTVVDTGANILANLGSLNLMTNVGSIVVSDGATLTLTSALKTADATALSKMFYTDGSAVHLLTGTTSSVSVPLTLSAPTLAQPAAPAPYSGTADLSSKLDTFNSSGQSIVNSDSQALSLTVNQALNDGQALANLTNADGSAVVVNLADTAANIASHLDVLGGVHGLGTITVTDGQALQLSVAQLNADAAAVAHLQTGAVSITDTAANIAAGLAAIGADAAVASVTVSNNTMVRVDASVFDADAAGLAKIAGRHIVDEIGIKGQAYTSELFSYNDAGVHTSNTFIAADGTRTIDALVGSQVFSSQPAQQIIHAVGSSNVFDFSLGFGSETIYGFHAGKDYIGIDHRIVSTRADALAMMGSDGQGDVVFHVGPNETITLVGVDVAQLAAQKDLFHFY